MFATLSIQGQLLNAAESSQNSLPHTSYSQASTTRDILIRQTINHNKHLQDGFNLLQTDVTNLLAQQYEEYAELHENNFFDALFYNEYCQYGMQRSNHLNVPSLYTLLDFYVQHENDIDRAQAHAEFFILNEIHHTYLHPSGQRIIPAMHGTKQKDPVKKMQFDYLVQHWDAFNQNNLKIWIVTKNKDGQTPFHRAAESNHKALIKKIIGMNPPLNVQEDIYSNTPLHIAAKNNSVHIAAMLIQAGACKNIDNKNGDTPLHLAAQFNHPAMTQLLIAENSCLNALNNKRRTPLHVAACHNVDQEIKQMLLNAGADATLVDNDNKTANHIEIDHEPAPDYTFDDSMSENCRIS